MVDPGNLDRMPRSIWSGAISFGLVNVPVKLYSAVSRKQVRFNQLHAASGVRIQQKRVNPETGEEVPYEDIVKGYEVGPGQYVVVTPEELESLDPNKTRTIDIEDFVQLDEIDPIFYDHPYYLMPDKGAAKAYKLLVTAMQEAGKVAIAKVVIRQKESLVAIRSTGDLLTMETMLFADEVVPRDNFEELHAAEDVEANKREIEMAKALIDTLSSEFDPSRYRDTYRERVLELIERKAEGQEIAVQPTEEPRAVPDLMAALEASVAAAKSDDGDTAKAKPKPAARKRAGAKKGSGAKTATRR
jgi:DNA end-binding protein Ku